MFLENVVDERVPPVKDRIPHGSRRITHNAETLLKSRKKKKNTGIVNLTIQFRNYKLQKWKLIKLIN